MKEYLEDLKAGGRPMTDKELAEHYKHLYSEVKKQKDDVVEYIKTLEIYGYDENAYYIRDLHNKGLYLEELPEVLLRMLGDKYE